MKKEFKDGVHYIEIEQQCSSCKGTGLYFGMAERDGFAVECNSCKGAGKSVYKYSWREFEGRKFSEEAKFVVKSNPGIVLGLNNGEFTPEDFGAVLYQEWADGCEMPEMRMHTCPAWWYQGVNYDLKPRWDECIGCGSFVGCENFKSKDKCWDKWDSEVSSSNQ